MSRCSERWVIPKTTEAIKANNVAALKCDIWIGCMRYLFFPNAMLCASTAATMFSRPETMM